MKPNELKEIIEIIEKAEIDVLKLEKGDFSLYYQKNGAQNAQIEEVTKNVESPAESKRVSVDAVDANDLTEQIEEVKEVEKEEAQGNLHQITSPIVGAFYSRPNPESDPFVKVGSKIKKNDIVCVLEAMKLFNEIKSDVDGEIVEILAEDGQIIEYGQPLFTVKVE